MYQFSCWFTAKTKKVLKEIKDISLLLLYDIFLFIPQIKVLISEVKSSNALNVGLLQIMYGQSQDRPKTNVIIDTDKNANFKIYSSFPSKLKIFQEFV